MTPLSVQVDEYTHIYKGILIKYMDQGWVVHRSKKGGIRSSTLEDAIKAANKFSLSNQFSLRDNSILNSFVERDGAVFWGGVTEAALPYVKKHLIEVRKQGFDLLFDSRVNLAPESLYSTQTARPKDEVSIEDLYLLIEGGRDTFLGLWVGGYSDERWSFDPNFLPWDRQWVLFQESDSFQLATSESISQIISVDSLVRRHKRSGAPQTPVDVSLFPDIVSKGAKVGQLADLIGGAVFGQGFECSAEMFKEEVRSAHKYPDLHGLSQVLEAGVKFVRFS